MAIRTNIHGCVDCQEREPLVQELRRNLSFYQRENQAFRERHKIDRFETAELERERDALRQECERWTKRIRELERRLDVIREATEGWR